MVVVFILSIAQFYEVLLRKIKTLKSEPRTLSSRTMKNYSKIGNRKGKPAYRTPAGFRYRKYVQVISIKNRQDFKKRS